jgi:uncharacterized membrane protein YphA (DoxX/SURF4 family)
MLTTVIRTTLRGEWSGDLGRHVLGIAAFAYGIIALTWEDFDDWQQLRSLSSAPAGRALVYLAAIAEVLGGIAIQWRKTARIGAAMLGAVYLFFACRWTPNILAGPDVYDNWANLFEQLSLVSGALIVYGSAATAAPWAFRVCQIGRYLFGVCVISFTLEQLVYLHGTAQFVPKWIPPGQMFWAITTTIALAAAAIAIVSGRLIVPASRLLTVMFMLFGLMLWLPRLLSNPNDHLNWAGNAQNLAITAAAWIVADLVHRLRSPSLPRSGVDHFRPNDRDVET